MNKHTLKIQSLLGVLIAGSASAGTIIPRTTLYSSADQSDGPVQTFHVGCLKYEIGFHVPNDPAMIRVGSGKYKYAQFTVQKGQMAGRGHDVLQRLVRASRAICTNPDTGAFDAERASEVIRTAYGSAVTTSPRRDFDYPNLDFRNSFEPRAPRGFLEVCDANLATSNPHPFCLAMQDFHSQPAAVQNTAGAAGRKKANRMIAQTDVQRWLGRQFPGIFGTPTTPPRGRVQPPMPVPSGESEGGGAGAGSPVEANAGRVLYVIETDPLVRTILTNRYVNQAVTGLLYCLGQTGDDGQRMVADRDDPNPAVGTYCPALQDIFGGADANTVKESYKWIARRLLTVARPQQNDQGQSVVQYIINPANSVACEEVSILAGNRPLPAHLSWLSAAVNQVKADFAPMEQFGDLIGSCEAALAAPAATVGARSGAFRGLATYGGRMMKKDVPRVAFDINNYN